MSALGTTLVESTRELGGVISPELAQATSLLYAPLHAGDALDDLVVERDQAYGADERHRLDLFLGDAALSARGGTAGVPVVAFVHGGNFVAGDKRVGDSPFYDNVGAWAARSGYLGVTLTYRLAPAAPFPAGRDDVGDALAWLYRNCSQWGGDPDRIILIGASAGATHVASLVARDADKPDAVRPAGVALLSGMYDLAEFGRADVLTPYYGPDPQVWANESPITGLVQANVGVLLAIAEYDPPAQQRQLLLLAQALLDRDGRLPRIAWVPGHNHFSEVLHIGTDDHLFTDQLSGFIAACADTAHPPGEIR